MTLLVGCASKSPKPVLQRGWIGGEYKAARPQKVWPSDEVVYAFPKELKENYRIGILVTRLSGGTPAQSAGLREGDLILAINQEAVTGLPEFRSVIDKSEPGTVVPMKVYRAGEFLECKVPVGRETYRRWGSFAIVAPPIMRQPDLWPNPDFSLVALGYRRDESRSELKSAESEYRARCNSGDYHPFDGEWSAWLAILQVSRQKEILSQENVPAPTAQASRSE